MLDAVAPLIEAGFAVHRLHPREKRPVGNDWSTAPVYTLAQLRAAWRPDDNVGVRLGEPSRVADHYLHVIDLDVRDNAKVIEAKAALAKFIPEYAALPYVISGSGGDSRHFYFLTERPFASRKLAHSAEKITGADGKQHWAWEVELFGTGKQVAMPPSIHPDTGLPYKWGREFDFDDLLVGAGPFIGQVRVGKWAPEAGPAGEDDDDFGALVRAKPMGLEPKQIAEILAALPLDAWCEDRDGWLQVGAALHHEFEGSEAGRRVWAEFSKQSKKFDEKDLLRVWKSFGDARRPTRMATLMLAARQGKYAAADDDYGDDVDLSADDDDELDMDALLGTNDEMSEIGPKLDWDSLLDLNEEGAIKPTLHNTELMVRNDPRTAPLPHYNEFTQEVMLRGKPGKQTLKGRKRAKKARQLDSALWSPRDPINGDLWVDEHDYGIRSLFEAPKSQGGYGIKVSDRDLRAAINNVAQGNRFHPVREYLDGLTWDGTARLESLFTRYLGADNSPYTRSVSRLTLLGAVVRAFEPGHKFDFVAILEGLQGKRKSSFIDILARHWFTEIEGNFDDRKAMVEKMQGSWILELPELQGFGRHEVSVIKAFVSAKKDKVRLAYAHRARNYERQCIFLGSTNDSTYLRDETGGRRFWPVVCEVEEIDTDRFEREVDQVWAEAVVMYRQMRVEQPFGTLPLYITDAEAKTDAAARQEERRIINVDDEIAGRVKEWLDVPLGDPSGFEDDADAMLGKEPELRNVVCAMAVWCEMMGEPASRYTQATQQQIGRALRKIPGWAPAGTMRIEKYGKQRIFRRIGVLFA